MQQFNWFGVCALAALVPMIMGFIWYSKAVFGKSWMRANRFLDEDMKASGGRMALTFILAYIFSYMIAMFVSTFVIHQFTLGSIIANERGEKFEAAKKWITDTMAMYGNNFRTFKHGAFHGTLASIMFVLPIISIISLFERRSWKYVLIHWGYWLVTLALMGGIICQFTKLPGGGA
jgi:hypothetical protein